jgi:hypothetical protein
MSYNDFNNDEMIKAQQGVDFEVAGGALPPENSIATVDDKSEMFKKKALSKLESIYSNDIKKILELFKQGKISKPQAEKLKSTLDKFVLVQKDNILAKFSAPVSDKTDSVQDVDDFDIRFFDVPERKEALEFAGKLSPQEAKKLSGLISKIENSAVARYLEQSKNGKDLDLLNNQAKARLSSLAQGGYPAGDSLKKHFTREEIKRMSNKEFAKNEKAIFEQMTKGLLA